MKAAKQEKINWEKLHVEFLTTGCSLNKLRIKHGIRSFRNFYNRTKEWIDERADIGGKTVENDTDARFRWTAEEMNSGRYWRKSHLRGVL